MLVVSHSDIAQFLKCRRSWRWGYVEDRTPPEKDIGALALGSRVHLSLEAYYRSGVDPVVEHQRLADAAIARAEDEGRIFDLEKLFEDVIVGRNCLVAYMEWLAKTGADHGYETIGVERHIEAPVLDGRVLLRGKTDTLFRRTSDGALIINDFKTTGRAISQTISELERSYQAYVYDIIMRLLEPDALVYGGMYTVLKKVTRRQRGTPYVERVMIPGFVRSRAVVQHQIMAILEEMVKTLSRIGSEDSDRIFYMTPGEHCTWCAFKHPCMIANENPEAAEEMLRDQFAPGRHRRYDAADEGEDET